MADQKLYDRLGGAFAIAGVIDHFSDALIRNPIVGQECSAGGTLVPCPPRAAASSRASS